MASSQSESSDSYDPSVSNIERRIAGHVALTDDEDDDDMDMDFEPALEDMTEESIDEDEEDLEYQEAEEVLGEGVEIMFELTDTNTEEDEEDENEDEEEDEDGEGGETETEAQGAAGTQTQGRTPVFVTREQIINLLGTAGLRRLLASQGIRAEGLESDDEDEDMFGTRRTRRRRTKLEEPKFEKVPSEVGQELIMEGTFGNNERADDRMSRKKKLAYRLMTRELGAGSYGRQKARNGLLKQDMIPNSKADQIIHYDARCYSGQFSNDGNFFFSCAQDFKVRMYDTSNPYSWKYYKVVDNPYGQWTITDASLSADNRWLAYSSISRIVCLAPTDPLDSSEPRLLDFSRLSSGRRAGTGSRYHDHFGIWSIRFSGDGREIVAGTSDHSVYVFDIERNQSILRIPGHEEDVNAVCFGDAASPHILYSGSDDTTLKVWDRRSLGDGRAAGVFLGHTEGLTYVDSKGDGRFIISNGKDQTAKLWDLRKVIPTEKADKIPTSRYTTHFEYRMDKYDFSYWEPHPHDCSLVTFRGHSVLKTLIRCHFSPPGSTDSRYVYSGSHDGHVYVWDLDGNIAKKINVAEATNHLRNRQGDRGAGGYYGSSGYNTCVRDASWHPDVPMIAATSWNGWGTSLGTCTVHSWNDGLSDDEAEPKMGLKVGDTLIPEPDEEETRGPRTRTRARTRIARALGLAADDDDE